MKKYNTIKYALITIVCAILLYFGWSLSTGWAVGWLILYLLGIMRKRFYGMSFDISTRNVGAYIFYYVFVFAILWIPPIISFNVPHWINPYALLSTYLLSRFDLYISGIFFKKFDQMYK